jgi:hypothetical protein
MSKKDFKEFICRPFCIFFRENSKEDLVCHGALVVMEQLRSGRLSLSTLSGLDRNLDVRGKHDAELDVTVCRQCSFKEEDCDFHSEEVRSDADPCGGYRVLSLLKTVGFDIAADLEEKNR